MNGLRALALMLLVVLAGCATRIEYFTENAYPPRLPATQVEWLDEGPSRPHIELARITITSANLSDESLRRNLLEKAQALGADAVVREVPVTVMRHVGSPYYEPGLFSPAGAAFLLYGYGWYTPFTSNPYILSQGATDHPRIDHYLSAIAIRFNDDRPTPTEMQ
jgi:hypothetical protein